MDIRKVKKLIELIEEKGINYLEIKEGEESVVIKKDTAKPNKKIEEPEIIKPPEIKLNVIDEFAKSQDEAEADASGDLQEK